MVVYDSSAIYIDSATTLNEKITRVKAIISALETAALTAAATGNITEYSLDDGQTKISSMYRSPLEIQQSIQAFEVILQRYINAKNGRVIRLVDSSNFIR